ncbi:glycosyltransferase family 2 protein [Chloroflexus sp.]|uniref:dolichyl-phosphate beta-glucosyltransferase n=1 Tax=Chloroflexus sp. TaxID=1904827 RepID=UPI00298F042C|nr:glycosyltransferase family 2 protein [Chloroflexus sp.]MCS6889478.1 glycosyltransferase family 2 protein [Chloroflexus sp.]MCX7861186.1 glycosyltransferase family 2 protein [Chloroflexus sp.]MDW8405722.1 glycosyltransferase family 2 protein [Chloroflexus sp.]
MMNTGEPFLSIVIPAYNEERRLPATLAAITAFLANEPYPSEVIVVDDGSEDRTAEVAAAIPSVKVLHCDHRGKGFAVRAGALAARGAIVLLCDADLAVPIEEWSRLRAAIEAGYPIAIGSREGVGATREGEPWYRHVMGRVFNWIIRLVALRGINDTQCGFKALRREVARDLFQRVRIYGDDAPVVRGAAVTAYDVELLFLAQRRGYPIAEIPVTWRYGAETKVNPLRDSWRNLRDVLRVRLNDLCGRYDVTSAPVEEVASR